MTPDIAFESLRSGPITLDGVLWLDPGHLHRFLRTQLGEDLRLADIRRWLRRAGLDIETLMIDGEFRRAWRRVDLEVHDG